MIHKIKNLIISPTLSLMATMKYMDEQHVKSLLVCDKSVFVGMITLGDIQRAIIKDIPLTSSIIEILDSNKEYCSITDTKDTIKEKMYHLRAECMPVINPAGEIVDVYLWSDLFGQHSKIPNRAINIPVVIMAGGKGTRLAPLTNIYPKPLIPVGEKTIIETIMDKFVTYGCRDFHISVNYKAEMLKNYFEFIDNKDYSISYFQEDRPLGTAGSLRLLKDQLTTTFFVSNCDTMIYEDFATILDYHKKNENELTVVAALKTLSVPYGTITTGKDGLLQGIEEKPSLSFKINVGLYILEPSALDAIPDEFFHITHLMGKLKDQGRRVGVYPISQNDWMDMGDWDEYLKLVRK